MRATGRRSVHSCLLVTFFIVLAAAATVRGSDLRAFAPVQDGFTQTTTAVPRFAPGRVMVKLTVAALEGSSFDIEMRRGAAARAATGLPSLDSAALEIGLTGIERPYDAPANERVAAELGVDRWFVFHVEGNVVEAAARLAADPSVEHATPDWRLFPAAVPNDPMYPDQWGHNNTAQMLSYDWSTHSHWNGSPVGTVGFDSNAEAAWDKGQGYGAASVIIAVTDSGVDVDHPDLRLVAGYDYGDNDGNPDDNSASPGHGTACAGVAAAVAGNGLGVSGIAGGASVMPLKIANSAGTMYFSSLQNALYHAADNGADIVSMSIGARISSDPATDSAILYAHNAGVTMLAATGNDNDNVIHYPAINAYVIGVGAASPCGERKRSSSNSAECNPGVYTDPNGFTCDGERWWGSNYGSTTQDAGGAVDVIAPTIMPTTDIGGSGGYASGDYSMWFNGTSCATPYAAGVCALILSADPTLTPAEVRTRLVESAQDVVSVESGAGWDRYAGYGMVDADAAVGDSDIPPTAEFSGSPTSGDVPLLVDFTDLSTGGPTSWSWDFGDGIGTSTAQNPSYTYTTAGTYTVTLTATNAFGSDGETKVDYVTAAEPYYPPTAEFTADPTSGAPPLSVDFTDLSTNDPTSWSWDFGDGVGTSTAQDPSYTYTAAGTYTVSLTVTNAYDTDTETKVDYITVAAASRAYALNDVPGDGTVAGSFTDTHSSDDVREAITEVLYQHGWDFSVSSGSSVTFHAEAYRESNSDGDNFSFEYSTDGVTYLPLFTVASATEQGYSASIPASTSGIVRVRVVDTNRSWRKTSLDAVHIDEMYFETEGGIPEPPVADFVGSPTSGYAPLSVSFADQSTGVPTSWSWDFGDGVGTSTAQSPSYSYADAGTYTVSLVAANAYGSDTETKVGYVSVTDAPQQSVHVSDISVSRRRTGKSYRGTADVTVVDQDGTPIANATVSGFFNAPNTGTKTGVTGAGGVAGITGDRTKTPPVDFCFTVTDIAIAGYPYDPGANVVTTSCESGHQEDPIEPGSSGISESGLRFNRPNPFRVATDVVFALPEPADVRLEVFNVAGRRIALLADRGFGAGEHSVRWDATGQPAGVYFVRLAYGETVDSRAAIVLR